MKSPKLSVLKSGYWYIYDHRKRVYFGKCDKKTAEIRLKAYLKERATRQTPPDASSVATPIEVVAARFLRAHDGYFKRDGNVDKQLARFKTALSFPLALYPELPADDFGAKKLVETRAAMVESKRFSRVYINTLVNCLRRVFAWAVENELVSAATLAGLRAVSPLKRGRSSAKERGPVAPVDPNVVAATLPELPPTVAAVVNVQQLTGMRPSEVLNMRVKDLTTRGDGLVVYTLETDKTAYRRALNDVKTVILGKKAAAICRKYSKDKGDDDFVFEASPGCAYRSDSYARAIKRAAMRAKVAHWSPYQLRHLYATQVRAKYGLEAAQVALGHKTADVTQIYAERDKALAVKIAKEMG